MGKGGKRVDGNQPAIVAELRGLGYTVADTHEVGEGFGDIVVGAQGLNFVFEIKDPSSLRWVKNQGRKLQGKEKTFHAEWKGQITVIESAAEAAALIERTLDRLDVGEGAGLGCGSAPGRPFENERI